MSFNHLKIKVHLYRKALKSFGKSNNKNKDYSTFKTGYYRGFNDCLKWIIRIFGCKNVGELKLLTPKGNKLNQSERRVNGKDK